MVFIFDMLFVLALALVLSALFTFVFKKKGPWASYLAFFLVLFFATWAVGVRMVGFGPYLFGVVNWLPYLFVGLIFALILAAVPAEGQIKVDTGPESGHPFNVYFWILIILLIIAVITAYVWPVAPETTEAALRT